MTPDLSDPSDVLARTLYGEARGEGRRGMEAVACVVLNRAKQPAWWGKDIASVCLKPWQFSCWNQNDPNRPKLLTVDETDQSFRLALLIARQAVAGKLADITDGADHYYDYRIKKPKWAEGREKAALIGHHAFYKIGPKA
ncbi:MAG: hydrolase [Planctomycetales bacterium 71-10]|mgnify:CR=1 FL=1|nr:MAG: hydrolase [Planctomycetales bacterium 71-10]